MRTLARRSVQTINNRTQFVSSFVDSDTSNEFIVRRLSERDSPARQLFIVTVNNNVIDGEIIPFAEIATSSTNKLRYVVKPMQQYPQLADSHLLDRIETAIAIYMKKNWNNNLH
ncbi:hypothetical protein [Pantoea ananatis]|uniref:hypothetical protein n=1 Tax=Pantoea ananas TaxID=553 RepID=UPI00092E74FD|nr:hypothetical protein [Pantoea ananatis]